MTPEFLNSIPTNEDLEKRFLFIDNEILRSNIVIYFRYVILLLRLSEERGTESLAYSLYKDIILYTASIIESLLGYTIKREILLGRIDKKFLGKGTRTEPVGSIGHSCDDLEHANATLQVIKKTTYFKYESKDRLDFKDFTNAARASGIMTQAHYEAAESLRKQRNLIHIEDLPKSSDDYFKKDDVKTAFKNAHDIILEMEKLYA